MYCSAVQAVGETRNCAEGAFASYAGQKPARQSGRMYCSDVHCTVDWMNVS